MSISDYEKQIQDLIDEGYTNPEISKQLNLNIYSLGHFVKNNLGGNQNYLKRRTKYTHIIEEFLLLRMKISNEKLMDRFNLTSKELRSLLSVAYKRKEFKHIRKNHGIGQEWTSEELRYLLKYSGIISREMINEKIKRGKNERVIKEKLVLLGLASKNINGLSHSQFKILFRCKPKMCLETLAGPIHTRMVIIPWMYINELIKTNKINCDNLIKIYIDAMAMFQKWVHGEDYWKSLTKEHNVSIKYQ